MKREPKPHYAAAMDRFLALVAGKRMSKTRLATRLARESGKGPDKGKAPDKAAVERQKKKLTTYETGQRAPGDVFRTNTDFVPLAKALGLLPSALIGWWAFGEEVLSGQLLEDIENFYALSQAQRLETLQLLEWQQKQGGSRKKKAAPPRAD